MKRKWKIILIILLIVLLGLVWFGESRKFYYIDKGQFVTVWKTYNNTCYVIPGKYYGIIKPSDNYIQTSNVQYLTIYFSDKMPRTIIVRNQGTSKGSQGGYVINNNSKNDFIIMNYSEKLESVLYKSDAVKMNDVSADAYLIDIYIKENYATDKRGKKL